MDFASRIGSGQCDHFPYNPRSINKQLEEEIRLAPRRSPSPDDTQEKPRFRNFTLHQYNVPVASIGLENSLKSNFGPRDLESWAQLLTQPLPPLPHDEYLQSDQFRIVCFIAGLFDMTVAETARAVQSESPWKLVVDQINSWPSIDDNRRVEYASTLLDSNSDLLSEVLRKILGRYSEDYSRISLMILLIEVGSSVSSSTEIAEIYGPKKKCDQEKPRSFVDIITSLKRDIGEIRESERKQKLPSVYGEQYREIIDDGLKQLIIENEHEKGSIKRTRKKKGARKNHHAKDPDTHRKNQSTANIEEPEASSVFFRELSSNIKVSMQNEEKSSTEIESDKEEEVDSELWARQSMIGEHTKDYKDEVNGFFIDEDEYTQYVYDDLDEDPDFLELVDKLADLFPRYVRTELKIRVKTCENIDVLVEELFLEQETDELVEAVLAEQHELENEKKVPEYSPQVYQLKDMFPTHDNDILQSVLDEAKGDMVVATNMLLGGNVTTYKSSEKAAMGSSRANKSGSKLGSIWSTYGTNHSNYGPKPTTSSWKQAEGNAAKLASWTSISSTDAASYIHKNSGNLMASLVDVINTHKKIPPPTTKAAVRGGRVQRGRSRPAEPSIERRSVGTGSKSYRYDPQSTEAQELQLLLSSNNQFVGIGTKFCHKALEFYNGDAIKVMDICRILLENNSLHLTRETGTTKGPTRPGPKTHTSTAGTTGTTGTTLNDHFAKYRARMFNQPEVQTQKMRLDSSKTSGVLDLHRLKFTTALQVAQKALREWWGAELAKREYAGNLDRYGSKAVFMDDLRIITGRGIHSVGGVSVIRKGVKEYLVRNRYLFDEQVGSFTVEGKKR